MRRFLVYIPVMFTSGVQALLPTHPRTGDGTGRLGSTFSPALGQELLRVSRDFLRIPIGGFPRLFEGGFSPLTYICSTGEPCRTLPAGMHLYDHILHWSNATMLLDNDPSAGSPTETLLRLLLPLNDQV